MTAASARAGCLLRIRGRARLQEAGRGAAALDEVAEDTHVPLYIMPDKPTSSKTM